MLALGLMLVLEGALPFIQPQAWRQVFMHLMQMKDGQIRFFGLASMAAGLLVLLAFS
jgi:uncharacterized protein YjeT (DUF2065 family)